MDCTGIELKVNTNADQMNGTVDIAKTSFRIDHAVVINHFHSAPECASCPNCQGKKVVVAKDDSSVVAKDDSSVTSVTQAVTVVTGISAALTTASLVCPILRPLTFATPLIGTLVASSILSNSNK